MITIAGRLAREAALLVPWQGQWVLKATLDGAAPAGKVAVTWGAANLLGSVDPSATGVWQGETLVTIVGGFGWSTVLAAQWLQNDAGLSGLAVAQQTAQLAGEALVSTAAAWRALRVSYGRPKQPGARTLADLLAAGSTWWVDLDGTTRAGARPSTAAPKRVEVLEVEADRRFASLEADDVGQVLVGSVIAAAPPRRPRALRIVELHASIGEQGQRLRAAVESV